MSGVSAIIDRMGECAVDVCDGDATRGALCAAHHYRWRKYGDAGLLDPIERYHKAPSGRACAIPGCEKRYYGRGWCVMHWKRWRRLGDPLASRINRGHDGQCGVDGCPEPYESRGLCKNHRRQEKYAADPSGALAAHARRRTKVRNSASFIVTVKDRARLSRMSCLACGSRERLQLEHLIPVDRGGGHGIGNLAMLCHSCNSSKRNQTWTEWRTSGKPRAVMLFGERGCSKLRSEESY